jgi:hypothetical protein
MTWELIKLLSGLVFVILAVIFGPLLGIWSLNTLFPVLHIPYTLETWSAFGLLFGSATGLNFSRRK